ncbi:MAG: HAD-IA family hydrolase, partial [Tateyamaria sp.]
DGLIDAHALDGYFVTRQVADFHPSKPHPAMLQAALDEAGVGPDHAVMVGDTSFDAQMAQAAGVPFIGVNWGYHPAHLLDGAETVLGEFSELDAALIDLWGE